YFGKTDLSSADLQDPGFLSWLRGLAAAEADRPALADALVTGPAGAAAAATFDAVGEPLVRAFAGQQKPVLTYPSPVASADVALGALAACSSSKGGGQAGGSGCTTVDVASSPEKFELLTQLAKSFNDTSGAQTGGCATVKVENKSSGAAADLLASGWQDEATN